MAGGGVGLWERGGDPRAKPPAAVALLPDTTGRALATPALPSALATGFDHTAIQALVKRLPPKNAMETKARQMEQLAKS